ncbi:MAG: hypothetical protein ACE5J5_08140 [Candidatus Hydrothermarchaeales archaeon]
MANNLEDMSIEELKEEIKRLKERLVHKKDHRPGRAAAKIVAPQPLLGGAIFFCV